ncbi:MAG: hypothetical protein ACFCUV_03725 [Rivularia sp. (in: cyanobacteria)]
MNKPEEELELQSKSPTTATVAIQIPIDTLEPLKKVAQSRNTSPEALLRFYIGQGLRQDLAKILSERVLESTSNVLAKHIQSQEKVATIMNEIKAATTFN